MGPEDYPLFADGWVYVQFALAQAATLWGTAAWHQARWSYIALEDFVDATCDVEGLTIERGRRDPLEHYGAAKLTLSMRDPQRRWSPGAVDEHGNRPLRVGTPVRVVAWKADLSGRQGLFAGTVLTANELDDGGEPTVAITAGGALSNLSADSIDPPTGGDGELAGARMTRVIAASSLRTAWWPVVLATGTEPLQPFETPTGTTRPSPLDLLQLVANSDGGALFERGNGAVVYKSPAQLAADTVAARFVDSSTHSGSAMDYCPASLTFTLDAANVVNAIGVENIGGTMVWAEDPASIAWSGRRPVEVDGLLYKNAATGPNLAAQLLARSARRDFTVSPVIGEAMAIPGWYRAALSVDLTSRVEVDRDDGHGLKVEASCRVGSLRHDITRESWTVRYDLEEVDQRMTYSRWKRARWKAGTWS
jgi:hypothetical protein